MRSHYKKLVDIVSSFDGTKILVIGDMVLDRFWVGSVQRISREAPVPIVRLLKSSFLPGCGANTASNIASLNAIPVIFGIIGEDREGEELVSLLKKMGAHTKYILRDKNWTTPTKTRILAGTLHGPKQQLVRVDQGEFFDKTKSHKEKFINTLTHLVNEFPFAIISDYGFGFCQQDLIKPFLKKFNVVAVDSRFNLLSFSNATTATPNEEEFEKAVGKEIPKEKNKFEKLGEALRKNLSLDALLVTRGNKGMALFEKNKKMVEIGIVGKDEVVDVTGAGDTVIATYLLSLAKGADFLEAAHIANIAGGIVVLKPGTATVSQKELIKNIELWGKGKI